MRRTMCAVLAICAAGTAPLAATRLGRATVHGRDGGAVTATLDRSPGQNYDAVRLTCGEDTIQALVNRSARTTIRVNGQQYVLSPRARVAWSRGGWAALNANDQGKIQRMLDMIDDPAAVIEAMIAVENGRVPDIDAMDTLYQPLAPGGCGVGGVCGEEAWQALKDFVSCTGSIGGTTITAFEASPVGAFFGSLMAFSNCADWTESHEDFTRCCGRATAPGGDGDDDDNGDPASCDHCLPPDVPGPNPPCCYTENP